MVLFFNIKINDKNLIKNNKNKHSEFYKEAFNV